MGRLITILLLSLVAALLHTQIFFSTVGARIEPWALDLWFNIRGALEPPEQVTLIAMDEASYEELGLPMDEAWPRAVHAKLLARLAELGVKRVVFDVLFYGPSDNPKADKALAEAFKLLPTAIGAEVGRSKRTQLPELFKPYDLFVEAVEQIALVGLPEDAQAVRRFKQREEGSLDRYPTLSEAAVGAEHLPEQVPDDNDFLRYYGPAGTITSIPYYEVIDARGAEMEILKEKLADAIVFVGLKLRTQIGPAAKDSYLTPFWRKGRVYGVEIHATAAGNLLEGQWISRAAPWLEGLCLAIAAAVITAAMFFLRPQWGGLLFLGVVLIWAAVGFSSFLQGSFVPGVVLIGTVLPFMYLLSTLYYYFVSSRAAKQTQKAFEMYLSPQMAKEVARNQKAVALGGENMYATALFTDIAGFTNITEGMLAQDVATMLNAYFTEVMGVIFEKDGTLIKFIGDSVFGLWGAPIKIGDHADKALQTAIEIQKGVQRFNASGRFPPLHTRVGIHTGPMVVGNLGSDVRFDYTAIGDSVNLASRLEGLNKYFGTDILISDATKREVVSGVKACKMGSVNVVGKSESVSVHAVFLSPLEEKGEEKWLLGLAEFAGKNWDKAHELISQAAVFDERLATATALYNEQIQYFRENPPSVDWGGEIVFRNK